MLRRILHNYLQRFGYDLVKFNEYPGDCTEKEIALLKTVRPFTLTSVDRLLSLIESTRYIARKGIPGAIVECGVWRGGSMMAVASTLLQCGENSRPLLLFDTFEGMPCPQSCDVDFRKLNAEEKFRRLSTGVDSSSWCMASLDEVSNNLATTAYPSSNIILIKGKVEDTVPASAPASISLLRLDTDWYQSTKHELVNLYPRLAPGGILIIDDYGHWQGARKAVGEYFAELGDGAPLLQRVDYSCRLAIKP